MGPCGPQELADTKDGSAGIPEDEEESTTLRRVPRTQSVTSEGGPCVSLVCLEQRRGCRESSVCVSANSGCERGRGRDGCGSQRVREWEIDCGKAVCA